MMGKAKNGGRKMMGEKISQRQAKEVRNKKKRQRMNQASISTHPLSNICQAEAGLNTYQIPHIPTCTSYS
jgi:hypothetical protein